MKKIIFFITLLLLPLSIVNAEDTITKENAYLECTYSNGATITYEKSNLYYDTTTYPTDEANKFNLYSNVDSYFVSNSIDHFVDENNIVRCPQEAIVYVLEYENKDKESNIVSVISFDKKINVLEEGVLVTDYVGGGISLFFDFLASNIKNNESRTYRLISEDIIPPRNFQFKSSCTYVEQKKQAILKDSYITIYKDAQNKVYIDTDDKMTNLLEDKNLFQNDSCPNTIYLNDSYISYDYYDEKLLYEENNPRYTVKTNKTSDNIYEYKLVENNKDANYEKEQDVCEMIPNTVVIIRQIIRYMSIIFPILIVIVTIIDISKLVASPNEENEKKILKRIRNRVLLIILFVFLPTIINVFLSLLYEAGIIPVSNITCFFM